MIAIIPARGGSKGLPGKNIRSLSGKPLIAYSIEAALMSNSITDVFISTDDELIAETAIKYGAKVPFMRPPHLATDSSNVIDAYIYTIERIKHEFEMLINDFVVLQPTSPLRTSIDIDNAIKIFRDKEADSVISYTKEQHPIVWHKYINEEGKFENIFDEALKNRQENRVTYYPNGCIYIFKYDIIKSNRYYTDNSYAYIMPKDRSIDIDYIEDFMYAEFFIEQYSKMNM